MNNWGAVNVSKHTETTTYKSVYLNTSLKEPQNNLHGEHMFSKIFHNSIVVLDVLSKKRYSSSATLSGNTNNRNPSSQMEDMCPVKDQRGILEYVRS